MVRRGSSELSINVQKIIAPGRLEKWVESEIEG